MLYEMTRVTTPMYMQRYVEYVLDVYDQLNMPYPFTVSLAYLASPVLMREEIFLAFDDEHHVVGCLSFIRGTAQEDYNNREIVQLQVLYIDPSYRSTRMLLSFMQMLVQFVSYSEEPAHELQFWCKQDPRIRSLIAKHFRLIPESSDSGYGKLDYYTIPYSIVQSYINQFPQQQYF